MPFYTLRDFSEFHDDVCAVGVRRDFLGVWGIFGNALSLR